MSQVPFDTNNPLLLPKNFSGETFQLSDVLCGESSHAELTRCFHQIDAYQEKKCNEPVCGASPERINGVRDFCVRLEVIEELTIMKSTEQSDLEVQTLISGMHQTQIPQFQFQAMLLAQRASRYMETKHRDDEQRYRASLEACLEDKNLLSTLKHRLVRDDKQSITVRLSAYVTNQMNSRKTTVRLAAMRLLIDAINFVNNPVDPTARQNFEAHLNRSKSLVVSGIVLGIIGAITAAVGLAIVVSALPLSATAFSIAAVSAACTKLSLGLLGGGVITAGIGVGLFFKAQTKASRIARECLTEFPAEMSGDNQDDANVFRTETN